MTATDAQRACALALAALPGIGPARLWALLHHAGSAEAAWELVVGGHLDAVPLRASPIRRPGLVAGMVAAARAADPLSLLAEHRRAGVEVLVPDDDAWPAALRADPEPPAVLFAAGDVDLLGQVSVAVVGTRRCSAAGVRVAATLAAGLTAAGVHVVSGLALGIDGAAHRAVLDAGGRPVGVVGSGLDRVYPARHRGLWADVAREGVLLSEAPLGVGPERWRFPARNRLIAALASAVVVVESRRRGGSMTTVEAALERDRPLLAVPGSVLAEQSAGTNQLISEGAGVARDADDVLVALGSTAPGSRAPVASLPAVPRRAADVGGPATPRRGPGAATARRGPGAAAERRPGDGGAEGTDDGQGVDGLGVDGLGVDGQGVDGQTVDGGDGGEGGALASVAAVLGPAPVPVEAIVRATGAPMGEVVTALARLEAAGRVRRTAGGYEQVVGSCGVP